MNLLEMTILILLISIAAGFLGSLTGLGGGVIIIPALALLFGINIRYAIGASLVSVIATSSGAAAAYVKEGYTNIRIGMFLEIATTIGALLGAHLATRVSPSAVAIIFGVVLVYSAFISGLPAKRENEPVSDGKIAALLRMNSSFPTPDGPRDYSVQRIPGGFGMMVIAGWLSGLLGIGSGAFKVLAMDKIMKIPFKVSTTTSNFMIGVTAAASAGIYLNRGYIDPGLAMPVMLGVLGGSLLGSRVLVHTRSRILRLVFAVIILTLAFEMIYNGFTGKL
jgi:uncharacterized membrane protein YfcA